MQFKNPAKGLLIYQIGDSKEGFFYFDGNQWSSIQGRDEVKSIATLDINGWALDGNVSGSASKAIATESSFIGTPNTVSINFKIGTDRAGAISRQKQIGCSRL
ncbi:MAG: hypothetical protein IPO04_06290 [Cytophagaceae bacterium]|nr:hypothetical protein [Cytophagaceae bacterium]